jgi:antagonist of KipI
MALEVIDSSGLATIQDAGRLGWRQFGVPVSGPMDIFAFHAANALAGNPMDYAGIEIGLGDATFRATQDCVIAVTGVGYQLSIYIWEFPLWGSFFVRAGWKIRLNKTDHGMWAYLAIPGGVQTPSILGSQSTYLRGAFGGLEGRQLQAGDRITAASHFSYELAGRTLPEENRPKYQENPILGIIMGPQWDYFTKDSIETFLSSEYSISLTSDRMGYRLEGPPLTQRGNKQLISEGMTSGAIQVPSNGLPIVIMADGPPTGGYPKIGAVASADLPLLAQCVPNQSRIRFRETTVTKAQEKYRAVFEGLQKIVPDE